MPRNATPFIRKTYDLVSDESLSHIITWSSTSDSFVILNPSTLESEVLPKIFKHNNLNSFVRQLNTYGFKKIQKKGSKDAEFKHKLFIKGQEKLLPFINRRSPSKTNIAKQKEDENYNIIKKSVEEEAYIKQLIADNENMTKELLISREKQIRMDQELYKAKRELLEARSLLRQFAIQQVPIPAYCHANSFAGNNNHMMPNNSVDTTFFDKLNQDVAENIPNDLFHQTSDPLSFEDALQLQNFDVSGLL
uniref:HSF-type DNA-binding domain-containing protein n=1 Tax=Vannella robusta TaxID=1487602 RepID=A0A7S4HP94_9EUKA|mmetsp:Transcript_13667/g.17208  ORF Transcript_13667/g.17208 Transcript_13667/m.17208 type:complete len:249 (+) Transcript_13667:86-832(+)